MMRRRRTDKLLRPLKFRAFNLLVRPRLNQGPYLSPPGQTGDPPSRTHPTEFTQILFATLFMELRGGLERGRHLVAKAEEAGY